MRYDYCCESCGSVFEISHSMKDDPKIGCLQCGADCQRLLYPPFIVNKNTAATDYGFLRKDKPKFIKDGKGNRTPYNPSVHGMGITGSDEAVNLSRNSDHIRDRIKKARKKK